MLPYGLHSFIMVLQWVYIVLQLFHVVLQWCYMVSQWFYIVHNGFTRFYIGFTWFTMGLHGFRRAPLRYFFLDTLTAPRPHGEKYVFPNAFQ